MKNFQIIAKKMLIWDDSQFLVARETGKLLVVQLTG